MDDLLGSLTGVRQAQTGARTAAPKAQGGLLGMLDADGDGKIDADVLAQILRQQQGR